MLWVVDFVKSKPIIVEEKASPLDPKTGKRMRCPLCNSRHPLGCRVSAEANGRRHHARPAEAGAVRECPRLRAEGRTPRACGGTPK
eukprot:12973132-Heterocapsa_arctica.AAC.1